MAAVIRMLIYRHIPAARVIIYRSVIHNSEDPVMTRLDRPLPNTSQAPPSM